MCNRFKHVVFAVLLLILPLQGLASVLTPILCHSDKPQTTVSAHAHGAESSSHEDAPSGHDNKPGTDYSGHLCCHHPAGVIPNQLATVTGSSPSDYTSDSLVWPPLFSPEQQLRPPRL